VTDPDDLMQRMADCIQTACRVRLCRPDVPRHAAARPRWRPRDLRAAGAPQVRHEQRRRAGGPRPQDRARAAAEPLLCIPWQPSRAEQRQLRAAIADRMKPYPKRPPDGVKQGVLSNSPAHCGCARRRSGRSCHA
jgi:hypothetical protein